MNAAASLLLLFSVFAGVRTRNEAPCPPEDIAFELITGHVYSSPEKLIETKMGTLRLGECVDRCRRNAKCKAVNFETGLCVLLSANLQDDPAKKVSCSQREGQIRLKGAEDALWVRYYVYIHLGICRWCIRGWIDDLNGSPLQTWLDGLSAYTQIVLRSTGPFGCTRAVPVSSVHPLRSEALSQRKRQDVRRWKAEKAMGSGSGAGISTPDRPFENAPFDVQTPMLRVLPLRNRFHLQQLRSSTTCEASKYSHFRSRTGEIHHYETARSANYNYKTTTCELSDMDRFTSWGQHTLVSSNKEGTLRRRSPKIKQKLRGGQATGSKADESSPVNEFDYIESNCVSEPVKMCDFQEIEGKILKTVDAVRQDVGTLEDCRNLCLEANFRCHTFDFGDTGDRVCRLSHHSVASLLHIEEPYLEVAEATSYQVTSCYNVTIDCQATGMVARIKTNKIFNGKVYVKTRPNSCVLNVTNNLEFELPLEYHDLNCDVRQETPGKFTADIIIQHHDQIVTSEDVGLSVKCSYNLQNRSVSNGMQLEIGSEAMEEASESSYVLSPTVSMRITDRYGKDIHTAQVGDPLSLRFEILDADTPYDIFVRELIALDGVDGSEILLIDSLGCPTDPTIMGALSKVENTERGKDSRVLQAPFDAFKFPTSDVVQFKALVTPCLPTCEPVVCQMEDYYGLVRQTNSYGRRKRSVGKINEEEMLVVQSIRIADKFQFERNRQEIDNSTNLFPHDKSGDRLQNCMTSPGLLFTVFLFLFAQLLIIIVWGVLFYRRQSLQKGMKKELRIPSLDQPTHLFYRLNH